MRHMSRHMSGSFNEICNNISGNVRDDMFVATKSQPKTKALTVQRQTKRPQSERRFKCDQCDRMFFTRKDVKRHMVVHTGIRNFACPFCTQRFGRKDHLVRHAKKSHNKDTRSSANVKSPSCVAQSPANSKCTHPNAPPTVLQRSPQPNHSPNKHSPINYSNGHNGDHSAIPLLTNNNNNNTNHNGNNEVSSNGTSYIGNHHPVTSTAIGSITTVTGESFYFSGIHNLDDLMVSNTIKTETAAVAGHYLAFPVNGPSSAYHHHAAAAFIPGCFVSNSNGSVNSCGNTAMAAFGIPVPAVCGDHPPTTNGLHAFTVDVNPSLPHFSQAFQ